MRAQKITCKLVLSVIHLSRAPCEVGIEAQRPYPIFNSIYVILSKNEMAVVGRFA